MMQHLAQLNIGKLLQPIDHPQIADFVQNLEQINQQAEQSKGFVWRLKDESGNATAIKEFPDPLMILNLSVWESVEDLKNFVYRSEHLNFYLRRSEWFEPHQAPHMVLWWIPAGHIPTPTEALERLEYLQQHGESEYAFTFRKIFTMA